MLPIEVRAVGVANGTPTFFINGRQMVAQPFDQFKKRMIRPREIERSDNLISEEGHPLNKLYEAAMDDNVKNAPAAPRKGSSPPLRTRTSARRDWGRRRIAHEGLTRRRPSLSSSLLGLPVPLLREGRADREAARGRVQGQGQAWSGRTSRCPSTRTRCPAARPRWQAAAASSGRSTTSSSRISRAGRRDLRASMPKELGLDMDKWKADMSSPGIAGEHPADGHAAGRLPRG